MIVNTSYIWFNGCYMTPGQCDAYNNMSIEIAWKEKAGKKYFDYFGKRKAARVSVITRDELFLTPEDKTIFGPAATVMIKRA